MIRLLETTDGYTFSPKEFSDGHDVPAYAILSHTWTDREITFQELLKDNKKNSSRVRTSFRRLRSRPSKAGYDKIHFCARQAQHDGLRYFWVDTCCIDKQNSTELGTAINSMFRWYRNATKCYVYLSDVSSAEQNESNEPPAWLSAFHGSRWFTRGWTLQELIAPPRVEFFSKEGLYLGNRHELERDIHTITRIPLRALSGASLVEFSIDERLSWVEGRNTKCKEDKAYSMLGIFGVYLPLIYGEGYESALLRLQEAIARSQGGVVDQDTKVKRVPSSTVPFPRDDDFITRDNLDAVCLLCARPGGRAALVGLGGAGKSQIAIEYTYRVLDESPETWVFWIHAETQERFREGYRKIADAIKMDGWNDSDPNVVMRLVRTWLCDKSNGKWLMVVDNADDGSVFFHDTTQSDAADTSNLASEEPLSDFLPHASTGSILVTSRSRDVAYRLIGATRSIVEVGPMNDKEARALLQKKFDFVVKNNEADTLIRALDAMPLALTQAAAFINIRAPLMSISKYLDEVCRSDHDRVRLLNEDSGDIRRDGRASSSIIRTWQISFEYIRKRWPTAAQLLSLMSLFNRQNIPDTLLRGRYGGNGDESVDFENDVYTLTSFSLIKPNVNGTSFDMHDLVQLSTKKWLSLSDELEYWKEIYVTLIDDSCLEGRPEDWLICRELFPHVQAALDNHPFGADALETWASVAHKASRYVAGIGEYTQAHKLALDALGVREELLGPEHMETLDSLNSLGMALGRLGRYDEAKKLHQKAMEAKERTLGAGNDDTLTSKLNLAFIYNLEGHWTEAEKLLKQILEVASKVEVGAEGHMHDVKLYTLTALATAYENLGHWEDAIEMKKQVLATREAQLGPDHPKTLNVKVQLAYAYGEHGRLKEAEKIFLEVLQAQEANGAAETDILIAKGHLATVYRMQGRCSEAEENQLHIVHTSKTKLGPNHPDTWRSMSALAITYRTQGRFEEARDLQLEVLSLRTTQLGEHHFSTLDIKTCLATTYWSMELFAESTALTLEVLEARTATLGPEHLLTVNSKADLAFSHHDQGRFEEASQLLEVVLSVRSEKLGKEHPTTLECMGNLAVTYYRQGKMESALETMERCHEAHERCVGKEHPNTVRYKEKFETWRLESGQGADTGHPRGCID